MALIDGLTWGIHTWVQAQAHLVGLTPGMAG